MQYVYLLRSLGAERKYIGCTEDLPRRILQHNKGLVLSTKAFRPWKLVYYEAFSNKVDAFNREKQLKKEFTKKRHLLERLKNSLKD